MARHFARILLIFLCFSLLALPVSAISAKNVQGDALFIGDDGSYQMRMELQFKLDQVTDGINFPIPRDADDVRLYKSRASTHSANGALQVEIPAEYMGGRIPLDYVGQCQFTRSDRAGFLELDLPLVGEFSYPIEALSFTVSLPKPLESGTDPIKFTSNRGGRVVETYLDSPVIDGNTITCSLIKPLEDHSSLTMHLTVPEEMFPGARFESWSVSFDDIAMYVIGGLALVYWLIFLRCTPVRRLRTATGPAGVCAGELGSVLIGQGGDLPMMVLSWAQMGYILIHLDRHGRVMLYKRMDMGNERCSYEQKCFRLLFGKQAQVSATGAQFARLHHKVASLRTENRGHYQRQSGSTWILRLLLAIIGGLAGISLGLALAEALWLQILLAVILCVIGFVCSFPMQDFILGLHLRRRLRLFVGLGLAAIWLAMGWIVGEPVVGVWMVGCQLLGGLAYGYGGRRTEAGKLAMSQILGLRRYFKTVSNADLQRILRQQPEYFFQMLPDAAALGVDAAFAKRFGAKRLPPCPWLTTGMDGHMTAREWQRLLHQAVSAMDTQAMRLSIERFIPLDRIFGKR